MAATSGARRKYQTVLLSDAEVDEMASPNWLIEGVLPQDTLALLYGTDGSFKSFVCYDLARCIAAPQVREWQGRRVARHGAVVYVAAEGAYLYKARKVAWNRRHGVTFVPEFHLSPNEVPFVDADAVATFAADVALLRPALIVVDTVSRCMVGLDENSEMERAVEAGEAVRRATAVGGRPGATVLFVHHTPKSGKGSRGDSKLPFGCDLRMGLTRQGKTLTATLHCDKQRGAKEFADITLRLAPMDVRDVVGADDPEPTCLAVLPQGASPQRGATAGKRRAGSRTKQPHKANRDDVLAFVEEAGHPVTVAEVAAEFGITPEAARKHLERLVADGKLYKPADGRYAPVTARPLAAAA